MPGEGFQPQIVQAQVESPGEFHRAHDVVDGQCGRCEFGFGSQERIVELGVVGDHRAAGHQLGEVGGDVGERRLILQHLRREAVHVRGTGVHARVEQTDHRVLDIPVVIERQRGNAQYPGMTRPKARGLHINDDPASTCLAGRPAPGMAHVRKNGTRPRQRPAHRIRVGTIVAQSA